MSFSQADYVAMLARLQKNLKSDKPASSLQKEVGAGGIQSEIEAYLKSLGFDIWYDLKRSDKKTTSRVGTPDLVGVYRGKAFAMEVKRPGGKPTAEQLGELMWLERAGAKTAVVYSVTEAINFLKSL